jgi:alkylhydroperoxidase family enzyme
LTWGARQVHRDPVRAPVVDAERSATLPNVYGLRPDAFERFGEMYSLLWQSPHVDASVVELIRLRIALLAGCESELAIRYRRAVEAGLDETTIAALSRWTSADEIDEPRRAVLRVAEQYVVDPHWITDDDFERLARWWSPEGIATIVLATAMCDALTRFRMALGVEPIEDGPVVIDGPDVALAA